MSLRIPFASLCSTNIRVTVLALMALLFVSCGPDPPDWKTVLGTHKEVGQGDSAQTQPVTTNQIVVYIDTSASMAGYVFPDKQGQTVFSHTLQEMRNLTTILNPPMDVLVRHVDTTVGPPLSDTDLSRASINQGLYSGKETDLAGAIGLFPKPLEQSPKPQPQSSGDNQESAPAPPAKFHVLITDGVQSTSQQRAGLACTTGSDQICVRKKILELLNNGWGGAVLGVRSEFNGKIYSEMDHSVVSYPSRKGDLKTYRPFYIYVFSPDRVALDHLVEVIRERLRPLVNQEEGIRELALTIPYSKGKDQAHASAVVPKDQQDALSLSRSVEENPARMTLRVDVGTEKTGPKHLDLKMDIPWTSHALYLGSPQERAAIVQWDLVPLYPHEGGDSAGGSNARLRFPELSLGGTEASAEGPVILHLNAVWPKGTGEPSWRVYRLEGRLNLEQQTPGWVRDWSTDDDRSTSAGNKTFRIENVLLGLWRNEVLKDQVLAEAYIRIGPQ